MLPRKGVRGSALSLKDSEGLMIIQFSIAIAIGILIARAVEWLFVALLKTIAANWIYYRPLLVAFFVQLRHYRKLRA